MDLQHLQLTEPGFQNMNGPIGDIEFKNGVSVQPLSPAQGARICSSMRARFVDGSNSSVAGILVSDSKRHAAIVEKMPVATEIATSRKKTSVELYLEKKATKATKEANGEKTTYTKADLEFIADEDGIRGLRKVGVKFGVKSNSIPGLIQGILKAQ